MQKEGTLNSEQVHTIQRYHAHTIDIANAIPMHLQAPDLARHTIISPNGKRFVVATFDDSRLDRGYVTAVYPQQNGYLTLVRLIVHQESNATPEQAIQRHITLAQDIQQGKMEEIEKFES